MAEWLVEEGIAEHRAVLLDGGQIIAARIDWPGALAKGQVEDAALIARTAGSPRGTARFASGEAGRTKLAQARPSAAAPRAAPTLAEALRAEGHAAKVVRQFPECDWDELWDEAWDGTAAFAGGSLHFAPTPAMTVIDIDGMLPPANSPARPSNPWHRRCGALTWQATSASISRRWRPRPIAARSIPRWTSCWSTGRMNAPR